MDHVSNNVCTMYNKPDAPNVLLYPPNTILHWGKRYSLCKVNRSDRSSDHLIWQNRAFFWNQMKWTIFAESLSRAKVFTKFSFSICDVIFLKLKPYLSTHFSHFKKLHTRLLEYFCFRNSFFKKKNVCEVFCEAFYKEFE